MLGTTAFMDIFLLYTILYLLSIAGIILVSIVVLLRRRSNENLYFGMFALLLSGWLLIQFIVQALHQEFTAQTISLLLQITTILPMFFSVYFYAFTKSYTLQSLKLLPHLILPMIWIIPALIPGLIIQSAVVDFSGIILSTTPLYFVEIGIVGLYVAAAVRLLLVEAHRSNTIGRRSRAKFLIYSIVQTFVLIVGFIFLWPEALIGQLIVPITCLVMIGLFAYIIIRHRLFDIRLVITRALAYALSLATIAIVYSLLAFVLLGQLFNQSDVEPERQVGFVLIALLLALTFRPLKRFFDRLTRAIFYQDAYDTKTVLDKVSSVLVRATLLEQVVTQSLEVVSTAVKAQFIAVVLIDKKTQRTIKVGKKSASLHDVVEKISKRAQPVITIDDLAERTDGVFQVMQQSDIAVAVRLETSKEVLGYILFGYKVNGNGYTHQDIRLVRIVADELAVAIQNALRYEEISRFNATLQKEVDEATKQLRESNKKLRALDEAKDEFISMASHQLRTPLTSVKGYVSMVLDGDAGDLTADQRKLLQEAYASSQRMVYMIADFLNISRIKTGKFLLEPTMANLGEIVHEEIAQLQHAADSRGLRLKLHIDQTLPTLKIDENKVRQVIMNFIDNAIFYSKSGGEIHITLEKNPKNITFMVKDEGIGVPISEQSQIFTKFFRASNARHARPDGTGIGLFMAKKVINAHGGEVIFNSEENKGSTFGFSLPLHPTTEKSRAGLRK